MRIRAILILTVFLDLILSTRNHADAAGLVRFETSLGDIEIDLLHERAPLTVKNFLKYVCDGDYDGSIVHRNALAPAPLGGQFVFAVQGGGFTVANGTFSEVPEDPPVLNEAGRLNTAGTIAMAQRGNDINSATSQWFINKTSNPFLDPPSAAFTVFGIVRSGMSVVDTIATLAVQDASPVHPAFGELPVFDINAPVDENNVVVITRATILDDFDGDCVPDGMEDEAMNNGDGNADGIPDREQPNVASTTDLFGAPITFEAALGTRIRSINATILPAANVTFADLAILGLGSKTISFSQGFLWFTLEGVSGLASVNLFIPSAVTISAYYKFGPTPDTPNPHLFEFSFDGTTGAQVNNNVVTLHLIDGGRGDNDGAVDGKITDPGGPAEITKIGDSGCTSTSGRNPGDRADLALIALFLAAVYRLRRRRVRHGRIR